MRVSACTESTRDPFSYQEFAMSCGHCQMLFIRVYGDTLSTLDSDCHEPLDSVIACASTANNNDSGLTHVTAA
jgi:hypothetical protein